MPHPADDLVMKISPQLRNIKPDTLSKMIDFLSRNADLPAADKLYSQISEKTDVENISTDINKFIKSSPQNKDILVEKLKIFLDELQKKNMSTAVDKNKLKPPKKHYIDQFKAKDKEVTGSETAANDNESDKESSQKPPKKKRANPDTPFVRNPEYDQRILDAYQNVDIRSIHTRPEYFRTCKPNSNELEVVVLIYSQDKSPDKKQSQDKLSDAELAELYKDGLKLYDYIIASIEDCHYRTQENIIVKPDNVKLVSKFHKGENLYFGIDTIPRSAPAGTVAIRGKTLHLVKTTIEKLSSLKVTAAISQSPQVVVEPAAKKPAAKKVVQKSASATSDSEESSSSDDESNSSEARPPQSKRSLTKPQPPRAAEKSGNGNKTSAPASRPRMKFGVRKKQNKDESGQNKERSKEHSKEKSSVKSPDKSKETSRLASTLPGLTLLNKGADMHQPSQPFAKGQNNSSSKSADRAPAQDSKSSSVKPAAKTTEQHHKSASAKPAEQTTQDPMVLSAPSPASSANVVPMSERPDSSLASTIGPSLEVVPGQTPAQKGSALAASMPLSLSPILPVGVTIAAPSPVAAADRTITGSSMESPTAPLVPTTTSLTPMNENPDDRKRKREGEKDHSQAAKEVPNDFKKEDRKDTGSDQGFLNREGSLKSVITAEVIDLSDDEREDVAAIAREEKRKAELEVLLQKSREKTAENERIWKESKEKRKLKHASRIKNLQEENERRLKEIEDEKKRAEEIEKRRQSIESRLSH